MDRRIAFTGVAGLVCVLMGVFLTAVMVAFVSIEPSMAHAATREQAATIIICLMWLFLGSVQLGMWAGYRMAQCKSPAISGRSSGRLFVIGMVISLTAYLTLPVYWVSHYQPNFYWWFVFVHIFLLFLVIVIAFFSTLVGRVMLKTT